MKRGNAHQIIVWVGAVVAMFILAGIIGWEVYYGYVVPLAQDPGQLSFIGLLLFAAVAGILVNFGPCSLAVLPAYLSFYLGTSSGKGEESAEPAQYPPIRDGIRVGILASLGVFSFYIVLGILFATIGSFLSQYAPELKLAVATIILVFGIGLVAGRSVSIGIVNTFRHRLSTATKGKQGGLGLFSFGIMYGAGGLSCFLPVFLPLIFFPLQGGAFFESIVSFLIFAIFQSLFLVAATIGVAYGKQSMFRWMMGKSRVMKSVAGVILILTAGAMYSIFIFLGM